MRIVVWSLVILLTIAATGMAQQPRLPSVTLPAALDRVLRDYERAWQARDAAALAVLFAEDGFVLSNGRPPVRGREAIRAAYSDGGGPLSLRALAYSTSGPTSYIIGAYGSDPSEDTGKFVLALRRGRDRRWLIAADIDNSSGRPGSGPPPTGARRDEVRIRDTIQTMVRSVDLHQWDTVRAAFGPRVELDYGIAEQISADEIIPRWQPLLSAFDWTRHELSGLEISLEGERARVQSRFAATHFIAGVPGGDTWVLHGRYEHELAKTPAGWKIMRMRMIRGESTGNPKLLDEAMTRAAAHP